VSFHVGVTRDFLGPDGELRFGDIGLGLLDAHPDVEWAFLADHAPELSAEHVAGCDGLLLLAAGISEATVAGAGRLRAIARFGVGYDAVDVAACTRAGVVVTITPDGVRRPVATALLTLVLALAHRLRERDALVRAGRWAERVSCVGTGLTGRTLGIVGLGNIGRDLSALARPLEMRHLAFDPFADDAAAAAAGAQLVALEALLGEADFVCLCCPLTEETRHLIDRRALERMKPTAYLVNAARGPVVDQRALVEALRAGAIAGAALDVFDPEPPDPGDALLALDNVLLTPHSVAWSDECFRLTGESACRSLIAVAEGRRPEHVVNPEALDRARPAA